MLGYICSAHSNVVVMLCVGIFVSGHSNTVVLYIFQYSSSVVCGYICSGDSNAVVLLCVGIFVLVIQMQ